jgi:hypothetical protein
VIAGSLSSLVTGQGQRKSENRRKVKEGNPIKPLWGCIKYPEVGSSELVWDAFKNSPYQGTSMPKLKGITLETMVNTWCTASLYEA